MVVFGPLDFYIFGPTDSAYWTSPFCFTLFTQWKVPNNLFETSSAYTSMATQD